MSRREQEGCQTNGEVGNGDLTLSKEQVDAAQRLLSIVGEISPIPSLELSQKASVFVFVPMYREFENSERLFESWERQKLPDGVNADVIFLVNNPPDASDEVKEDNKKSFDYLDLKIRERGEGYALGMHVIDRFSDGNALPSGVTIGAIRNVAMSAFVEHALKSGKNSVVLSTDADSFPSENVIESLDSIFKASRSVYGVIERELEFSKEMEPEEREKIEKLFLMQASEAILLDYLTYGKWVSMITTSGSSTFFTMGDFLAAGGFDNSLESGEDLDLGRKLDKVAQEGPVELNDCNLVNIQRYSDRVDGDGLMFQSVKDNEYKVAMHADLTVAHADLRKWLISSLALGDGVVGSMDTRAAAYIDLAEILYKSGAGDIQGLFDSASGSPTGTYEAVFENAINILYRRKFDIDEAMVSYDDLIINMLGNNSEFLEIVNRLENKGVKSELIVQTALEIFAQNKSKSGLSAK